MISRGSEVTLFSVLIIFFLGAAVVFVLRTRHGRPVWPDRVFIAACVLSLVAGGLSLVGSLRGWSSSHPTLLDRLLSDLVGVLSLVAFPGPVLLVVAYILLVRRESIDNPVPDRGELERRGHNKLGMWLLSGSLVLVVVAGAYLALRPNNGAVPELVMGRITRIDRQSATFAFRPDNPLRGGDSYSLRTSVWIDADGVKDKDGEPTCLMGTGEVDRTAQLAFVVPRGSADSGLANNRILISIRCL
jgi:hypothetical protein